ncbi:Type I transmembrane sorting receptor [Mortierella sp. NVP41]|nr:Type I transmembrane sorting receptor [Mortierella sp. NVP41]
MRINSILLSIGLATLALAETSGFEVPLVRNPNYRSNFRAQMQKMRNRYGSSEINSANKGVGRALVTNPAFDSEYYGPAQIGNPPQTLNMNFDTGLSDIWLASSTCKTPTCSAHAQFNPKNPKPSARTPRTAVSKSLMETGVGGVNLRQTIGLATNESAQFAVSKMDGMFGLTFSNLESVPGVKTFMDNAIAQKAVALPVVSAYLPSLRRNPRLLEVLVQDVLVSGKSLNSSWQGIVDTGTTLVILDQTTINAIQSKIKGAQYIKEEGAWVLPCSMAKAKKGSVGFRLAGKLFEVPMADMVWEPVGEGSSSKYCFSGVQALGVMSSDGEVFEIETSLDPDTNQQIVYWKDITFFVPKALYIKKGCAFVTFVRNAQQDWCVPRRIRHYPGVVLEVIEGENTLPQTPSHPAATVLAIPASIVPEATHSHFPVPFPVEFSAAGSTDPSQLTLTPLALHETATASPASVTTAVPLPVQETALASASLASHRLLVRTQFMLQASSAQLVQYERSIQAGQVVQADAIHQGLQTMQEIRGDILALRSEVAKSDELKELRQQISDMQAAADAQANRIIELQELSIKMHQESLDRLALIQSKVAAIMTQIYELHEYPIPRLFIVLPKEDTIMTETLTRGVKNLFAKQFKLYFLCECGDHTKPTDGQPTNPNLKHEIHIARHEGYDIDRPTEFFDKYGSYVLTLLQMLKYGVAIAGVVVPPMGQLKIVDSLEGAHEDIKHILDDLGPRVDSSIAYIESLTGVQSELSSTDPNSTSTDPATLGGLEALEGADLRQLESFLKASDGRRVLGNLYRTVTSEGHVKWVCLDHYRENYRSKAAQELRDAVLEVGGEYNEAIGSVTVKLPSSITARRFYSVLSSSRSVQVLSITLRWSPSMQDLRDLRDAIKTTNVFHVVLDGNDHEAPLSDLLNTNRRSDPILQLMAGANIRSFELHNWAGFLDRISNTPATFHLQKLDISLTENWSKRVPRLVGILTVCPFLSELILPIDAIEHVVDPFSAALKRCKRSQALRLTVETQHSKATVEYEAYSGRISSTDLRLKNLEETVLLDHPSLRSIHFHGQDYKLLALVDRFRECLRNNTGLESIKIDCSMVDFISWMHAFRELFAKYPQQTPRLCLNSNRGNLSTSNIQDPTATTIDLESISINELATEYLGAIPDSYTFKARRLVQIHVTTPSDVETLVQFCRRRSGQRLFSALCLCLHTKTDPSFFPALLKALEECVELQDIDVQFRFIHINARNLFASPGSQYSLRRIIQDYTTHIVISSNTLSNLAAIQDTFFNLAEIQDTFDELLQVLSSSFGQFDQFELGQDLFQTLRMIMRKDTTERDRFDTLCDDGDTNTTTATIISLLRSANRLRELTVQSVQFTDAQWMDLVCSIDVLSLQLFSVEVCQGFTSEHLSVLVDRCITTAAEVPASEQSPTAPSDPSALQESKARDLHYLHIVINDTLVKGDDLKRETERLKTHNVGWVLIGSEE